MQHPSPQKNPNNQTSQNKESANNAKNDIKNIISLPFSKTIAPKLNYIISVRNNKRVLTESNQQKSQNLSQHKNKIQNDQNLTKEAKNEQKVLKISMFSC